ncbi:MAG: DUF4403 family protein [Nitrospirales bacterium]|nr:DUF4403 family protein [Nitrospirales bacterium]
MSAFKPEKARNMLKRGIALLPYLLFTAACSHTIPQHTAKPVPPPQYSAPTPGAIQTPVSQLPDSALPVTLVVDLTPLEQTLQTTMPERFSEARHPLRNDYRWDFVRDGAPQVSIQDGLVTIHTTYTGDIEARTLTRGCRLDPIYPILDTTGQLELRQEGDFLVLGLKNPQTTIALKSESESKCNMFNIPVKDQLAELINRGALVEDVKRAVDEGGFKIPLQQVWTRLEAPVAVNVVNINTQACLYGKPAEMAIGTLKGNVHRTIIPIMVKETPTATFESSCGKPSTSSMKVTSGSTLLEGQPYKVLASVAVPYSALDQVLQEKLYHQQMTFGGMMKDNVIIDQITASDSAGKVLLAIRTTGDLNGTLYYWGTPRLEGGGSVMTIPDLQMAAESKKMLDDIKVGYWQLIDPQLREKLQTAARVDLTDRIAKMKTAMTGTHKSGDLTMDVRMARQQAQRAYSTPGALVADILFEGTASASAPVAMETGPAPGKTPTKAPIVSDRRSSR